MAVEAKPEYVIKHKQAQIRLNYKIKNEYYNYKNNYDLGYWSIKFNCL